MFKVIRSQVDVVLPGGVAVLNAADSGVVEMQRLCDGEVIFYSTDPDVEAIAAHRASNGRAVCVRQNQVVLATGGAETFLPGLGKLSAWCKRHAKSGISEPSLLATVATAWALDIPLNLIGAGIEAFESNPLPAGRAA